MSGPLFTTDVTIQKSTPKLTFDDTGASGHTWNLIASGNTWELRDGSASRILLDEEGRVGLGGTTTGDLGVNLLTLKRIPASAATATTLLGMIHGSTSDHLSASQAMIFGQPYIAPATGNKYWGLALHPVQNSGGGQVDVIGLNLTYSQAAVSSITRSGSTATVTTGVKHGYVNGDAVTIAGATQSQYNGTFTITVTGLSTFTYPVSGSPATPATGMIYQSGPSEGGLFIGGIDSSGSGSSYGAHFSVTTLTDPTGHANERGLLITINRRPGCPVGTPPGSFSRGIEISSEELAGNLAAGDAIIIFGDWQNGVLVDPNAGNNGFGTITPSARLHVSGPGDETIKLETTGGVTAAWSLQVLASDGMLRVSHGGTNAVSFGKTTGDVTQYSQWFDHDHTTDVERGRRIYCGGNLRIKLCGTGNNSAHGGQAHLIDGSTILGAIRIGSAGTPTYQVHLTNDSAAKPSSSTWTVISDEKTKTNLRPFTSGLDVLRQLNLQTWEYNGQGDTPAGQVASGMVAQDLQPVLPAAVKTTRLRAFVGDTDQAEFLGVDYHLLFLSGLNGVRELDAKLTQLQAEVTELRGRVN